MQKNEISDVSFQPGICHATIDSLGEFLTGVGPKDTSVVLMFDSMYLRGLYEYDRFSDSVLGVQAISEEKRSNQRAQCLLVFMVRSIIGGWIQIIGHHFTKAAYPKEDLDKLLKSYLTALTRASIDCKAVICDQEPGHVSLFKSLGVTRLTPFVRCPSSGKKVYVMYDPPHLLKSARNNLIASEFVVSF